MFWSKIWLFVLAACAAVAAAVALMVPRPTERVFLDAEDARLERARWGVEMLLRENARMWVDLASSVAVQPAPAGQPRLKLDAVLDEASRALAISPEAHATARDALEHIQSQVSGGQKPAFLLALDRWGRLVAGIGSAEWQSDEDLSGYELVGDALRGYLGDDLWLEGEKLYRVAAAPVIERERRAYVGAVVLGAEVNLRLAADLEERVKAHVGFFANGEPIATSIPTPLTSDIQAAFSSAARSEERRAAAIPLFSVAAGRQAFRVGAARLPGEVGAQQGFFAVFAERPSSVGLVGTLTNVTRGDLAAAHFPWALLGGGFLAAVVVGLALLWLEADRPLRSLVRTAAELGKGESHRLPEEAYGGRLGRVARSVNLALERAAREARPAKRDVGEVLGPPPDDALFGGPPIAGTPLLFGAPGPSVSAPPAVPAESAWPRAEALAPMELEPEMARPVMPPPVEAAPFAAAEAVLADPARPPAQPPARRRPTVPFGMPVPSAAPIEEMSAIPSVQLVESSAPLHLNSTEAAPAAPVPADGDDDAFRRVFDDFIDLKRRCQESVEGLRYEKFVAKLRASRDQAMARYSWRAVRFHVYVKDGKAAVKVMPMKG